MSVSPAPTASCAECSAPLAPDQRYCVACGARRGPLPAFVAARMAPPAAPAPAPRALGLPGPWASGFAVLVLLAFGVLVGSLVSPPAQGVGARPVLLAYQPPAATAPATGDAAAPPSDAPLPTVEAPVTPAADAPVTPVPVSAPATSAPAAEGDTTGADDGAGAGTGSTLPPVKHVFLIVLSGHGYEQSFGAGSAAPYLATTLRRQGTLLEKYYAVTQGELANGIALLSGQGPTHATAADCPAYVDVAPGTAGEDGQVAGDGCVYPATAQSLPGQLVAADLAWRAYVQGMGATSCRHPVLGAADPEAAPRPGDAYVTWRNPFVYFHALLDGGTCATDDVDLDRLATDLRTAATTPSLSYIVPDRCHDGSDTAVCAAGAPTGLAAADAFLRDVVPEIERSAAYKDGGLIAITFDEAPQAGPEADATGCCNAPEQFPNLALPATAVPAPAPAPAPAPPPEPAPPPAPPAAAPAPAPASVPAPPPPAATEPAPPVSTETAPPVSTETAPPATTGTAPEPVASAAQVTVPGPPGGGRVGLLLISPFVAKDKANATDSYNHFSLLRSIEDLFDLEHLGYAADPALPAFDKAVYSAK